MKLFLLLVLVWSTIIVVSSSSSESTLKRDDEIDLESLTNEELEQICMMRGFELKKEVDAQTGKLVEYSHEDYVEAARQCLDIEAEMEKIIEENPDILKEIEKEAAEMKKEHDQLQKEKEELEKNLEDQEQLLMKEKAAQKMKDAFFTDDVPSTTTTTSDEEQSSSNNNEPTISQEINNNEENDDEEESIIDLDDDTSNETKNKAHTNNNDTPEKTSQQNDDTSTKTSDTEKVNKEATETSNTITDDNSNTPSKPDTSPPPTFQKTVGRIKESDKPLLAIQEIVIEFKEQIQKDLTRIGNIVLPPHIRGPLKEALKPAIRIGKDAALKTFELVKRYTAILFKAAKERVMEEIRKRREAGDDLEEESPSTTNSATI